MPKRVYMIKLVLITKNGEVNSEKTHHRRSDELRRLVGRVIRQASGYQKDWPPEP